jgi:hypothetical protein
MFLVNMALSTNRLRTAMVEYDPDWPTAVTEIAACRDWELGLQAHLTEDEARAAAARWRDDEIAKAERKIARLQKLTFEKVEGRDG